MRTSTTTSSAFRMFLRFRGRRSSHACVGDNKRVILVVVGQLMATCPVNPAFLQQNELTTKRLCLEVVSDFIEKLRHEKFKPQKQQFVIGRFAQAFERSEGGSLAYRFPPLDNLNGVALFVVVDQLGAHLAQPDSVRCGFPRVDCEIRIVTRPIG